MNWSAIMKLIGPTLVRLLQSTIENFGSTTVPPPVSSAPPSVVPKANDAIKHLQAFLNVALSLNPKLEEDGWLGPRTEAAIDLGIEKLKSLGIG